MLLQRLICRNCVLGTFLGTRLGTDWSFFTRLLVDNCQIALRWRGSPLPKMPHTLLPPPTETGNGEACLGGREILQVFW